MAKKRKTPLRLDQATDWSRLKLDAAPRVTKKRKTKQPKKRRATRSAKPCDELGRDPQALERLRADILASERPPGWFGRKVPHTTKEMCLAAIKFIDRAFQEIPDLPRPDEATWYVTGGVWLRWYCCRREHFEYGVVGVSPRLAGFFFVWCDDEEAEPTLIPGTWARMIKELRWCVDERKRTRKK